MEESCPSAEMQSVYWTLVTPLNSYTRPRPDRTLELVEDSNSRLPLLLQFVFLLRFVENGLKREVVDEVTACYKVLLGPDRGSTFDLIVVAHVFSWCQVRRRHV